MRVLGERFRKCSDCSVVTVPELAQKPLDGNYVSYLVRSSFKLNCIFLN
jgi:hypothetical protein